jgi:hypothetical protein
MSSHSPLEDYLNAPYLRIGTASWKPHSNSQALMAKAVTVGQLGMTAVALGGDRIFPALGIAPPALYVQYREKKMGVLLGIWILGNLVQNSLTATGAFEVYSAGEKVHQWSFPLGWGKVIVLSSAVLMAPNLLCYLPHFREDGFHFERVFSLMRCKFIYRYWTLHTRLQLQALSKYKVFYQLEERRIPRLAVFHRVSIVMTGKPSDNQPLQSALIIVPA